MYFFIIRLTAYISIDCTTKMEDRLQKVSEYDQEMPQSHTADEPRGSREADAYTTSSYMSSKGNKVQQLALCSSSR